MQCSIMLKTVQNQGEEQRIVHTLSQGHIGDTAEVDRSTLLYSFNQANGVL